MVQQLTIPARITLAKKRFLSNLKASVVNDRPPVTRYRALSDVPSLQAIKDINARYPLSSILPYESFDVESGVYYNRDTAGFLLYANPATSLDERSLQVLEGLFSQSHAPDSTIQISLFPDPNIEPILDRWRASKRNAVDQNLSDIFDRLAKQRCDYLGAGKWQSLLTDQPYMIRNFHLFISCVVPFTPNRSMDVLTDDELDSLMRTRESFLGTLRSAGIFAMNTPPELFINTLNGFFNPHTSRQPPIDYDEDQLIADQMIDPDTMILFDSGASTLTHQDEIYTLLPFEVRQFPKKWPGYRNGTIAGSFTDDVLRIPCPFIATLTVSVPDQVARKGSANTKSMRATQMSNSGMSKFVPTWKQREQDWNYAKARLEQGDKLLDAFFQIVLLCPHGREQEASEKLNSVYGSMGWTLSRSRFTPVHSLAGALPMGLCQDLKQGLQAFRHFRPKLSSTCVNIAPWIAEWKGTGSPMMMFNGRRGQLTFFDPFDNDKGNYNVAVCAASGSGKSFFTQDWVYSCLGDGGRAFIIDAGHSYRNLCQILGGVYLDFGDKTKKICLNPFSSIEESDPEHFKEQLPLIKILIGQMASPEAPLSPMQNSILEQAITETWSQKGAASTITDVVDRLAEDQMNDIARDLSIMLHSYGKGVYREYFDGPSTIDLDSTFVVLDLDALNRTPDLQSVVLLILMIKITQVMYLSGNRAQRKLCIIDEAWRLLGRGHAGEFIEEGYRVARKHGGMFMTITQSINDYYKSPTAEAAYANADFIMYLRQKPDQLSQAEEKGRIDNSDGKIDLLRSLVTVQGKYSEIAISSPDGISIVRLTVDPYTEKLFSTQASEVDYIEKAQARGENIFDVISQLVSEGESR